MIPVALEKTNVARLADQPLIANNLLCASSEMFTALPCANIKPSSIPCYSQLLCSSLRCWVLDTLLVCPGLFFILTAEGTHNLITQLLIHVTRSDKMRRDKKFALLLILSIINVTLASPVVVRERQVRVRVVDVAKDVTAASEKRYNSDNEADPGFVTAPSSPSGSTHNPSSESGASTPLSESTSSGGTSLPSSQVWTEGQHIWPDYPWRAIPVAGTSSTMSGPLSFNGHRDHRRRPGRHRIRHRPAASVGSSSSMPSLVDSSGSLTSTGRRTIRRRQGRSPVALFDPAIVRARVATASAVVGWVIVVNAVVVDSSGPLLPAGSPPIRHRHRRRRLGHRRVCRRWLTRLDRCRQPGRRTIRRRQGRSPGRTIRLRHRQSPGRHCIRRRRLGLRRECRRC
ncbi:hypothetical protein BJV77DRAFT_327146 [Russula vinacea]|nr:hypothetical protein BJV77DRAFT_327146 [Russula vinacea]